ncbi:MAG: methyltransferase [Leptospiraceae bacterium]|nr:methyltransferase [Leptospiraceae bacterium]
MQELKSELKNIFTSYWYFLALQKACQLDLFDIIEEKNKTISEIITLLKVNHKAMSHLIMFLIEEKYVSEINNILSLTEKGLLLTESHPESLKNACILWGEEHLKAWENIDYTLKTGKPSFENIYGKPFFDYLESHPDKLKNYHLAMRDYAKDDYFNLAAKIDFSIHKSIADVGGGVGTLIEPIALKYKNTSCILFDLENVVNIINTPSTKPYTILSGNFFEKLPFKTDAIILSRVLHDWNDKRANTILSNCRSALNENGRLYVIEILQNENTAHLLCLNMLGICESHERTLSEYQKLLHSNNFKILETISLNHLQRILICH